MAGLCVMRASPWALEQQMSRTRHRDIVLVSSCPGPELGRQVCCREHPATLYQEGPPCLPLMMGSPVAGAEEAEQRYMMPLGASWVIPAHTPLTTKPVTRLCRHQWQELLLLLIASSDDLQPPPPETETTRSPTCNWKTVLEFVHLAVTISSLNQTCSLARRTLLQIWPSAQQGPVPGCAWHEIKLCDIVIVELHLIKAKVFLNTHVAGEKKLELCGGAEAGPGLGVGADVS
ncbi:uncharacterized protein LOC114223485 isoform X1 [Eumetopias jubatus]|uniref:uncharacterized protein LOC114223485 isoform X1 n=1 Tax=Eumetopias jubatus TaxID=34886 RepID=UPI001016967E|nr:uncharacterized protein LOC114223485 isoform X1 [Eumetopias jubatus]